MQINQLKLGTLLSYLLMILSVLIGLLYTPAMIRLLGQNEYGLYNTVASTISMLSILSLGFNSGYIKFFAKYKEEKDTAARYRLNGLFLLIFCIMGLIAVLCGLYLTNHLNLVFHDGLTAEEYDIARVLMGLLTLNLAVSFPMSVFQNIISAHERFVFLKSLGILKTVISPLITYPLLLMGYRSIVMASVTFLVSLIADIFYLVYVLGKLKERFYFSGFEKGLFKSLFAFSSFIALNTLIDQINWNIDKILLGRFKGTATVAIYAVGYTLYNYYMMISSAISGVFTPKIHRLFNENQDRPDVLNQVFTDLFIKVGRVQFLILGLIASGIFFFGSSFIRLWVGKGYEDSYIVALLLILPGTITLIQNIGIEIQRAENKHQFRSIVYSVMAAINLILSIYLCQRYGAIGSAIGTAISLIIANGFIMNFYYHKYCGINIRLFWKNIFRMSCGLILPIALGIILTYFINIATLLQLLVCIIVYSLVYGCSVWLVSMNKEEKELVLLPVKRIIQSIKRN